MLKNILFEVISAWQVIIVGLIFIIILPVVFYFASFDKNPVKISKIPVKKKTKSVKVKEPDKKEETEKEKEEENG